MPRRTRMLFPVVSVLVAALGVALPTAGALHGQDANFPTDRQARAQFDDGVQFFRSGRYAEAAAAFANCLKLDPDNRLCYQFYMDAGDGLLIQMETNDTLRPVLRELLAKARIYQRQLRRDPAYIDLLITKLRTSEDERVVATNELVAVGPIAVPRLLSRMGDNRQDNDRVVCRVVLTRMGYRAVLPLIEALNSKEPRILSSVAAILADVGDARALPRLQMLRDHPDTDATVRRVVENTIIALSVRTGGASAAAVASTSVETRYLSEALRYFRDGDLVRDEMVAAESLLWRWIEPEGGVSDPASITKALTYVTAPTYAWNELMAEELLYDLAAARPDFAPTYPVLAADLAAQDAEVRRRQRMVAENTMPPRSPDGHPSAVAERTAAADGEGSGLLDRVRMFGPVNLYRAYQQSVVAERFDAAAAIAGILRDRSLAQADLHLPTATAGFTPAFHGTPLVAALDHGSKSVRYPAAMTLAHLDSLVPHPGVDKVVPLLAQAVSEWGMRVVLVIDQDYRYRNLARSALQSKGYMVRTVTDGFEAMQALEEAPIKDAIIIPGDLLPTIRNAHGQLIPDAAQRVETLVAALRLDNRSARTPIFISLPEEPELANKIQAALAGKVDGFVKKPFNPVELNGLIEAALAKAELPNVNREEAEAVALEAAMALQKPDPSRTQYDLTAAAPALVTTLENRSDTLRTAALKALLVAVRHPNGQTVVALSTKIADLYISQEANLTPGLRAAWVEAIGAIDPGSPAATGIISRALAYSGPESALVRAAAAAAAGRYAQRASAPDLLRYLSERRMDLRTPGAGNSAPTQKP